MEKLQFTKTIMGNKNIFTTTIYTLSPMTFRQYLKSQYTKPNFKGPHMFSHTQSCLKIENTNLFFVSYNLFSVITCNN